MVYRGILEERYLVRLPEVILVIDLIHYALQNCSESDYYTLQSIIQHLTLHLICIVEHPEHPQKVYSAWWVNLLSEFMAPSLLYFGFVSFSLFLFLPSLSIVHSFLFFLSGCLLLCFPIYTGVYPAYASTTV